MQADLARRDQDPADYVASENGPALMTNLAASRAGTAGRYQTTHLVVPASLRRSGTEPRAFCGITLFGPWSSFSPTSDVAAGEACDRCLPGLAARIKKRKRQMARAAARGLPAETE